MHDASFELDRVAFEFSLDDFVDVKANDAAIIERLARKNRTASNARQRRRPEVTERRRTHDHLRSLHQLLGRHRTRDGGEEKEREGRGQDRLPRPTPIERSERRDPPANAKGIPRLASLARDDTGATSQLLRPPWSRVARRGGSCVALRDRNARTRRRATPPAAHPRARRS